MNAQTFQTAPIYTSFHGLSTLDSPHTMAAASDTVFPHSPLTVKKIGSVESLPTNKATNVRNDGSLTRHAQNRTSCHLDLLDARTLTDLTDNTLDSETPGCKNQTASPYNNNNKTCHKTNKDKSVELYKTEWCRNWQELGVCRYGKKCRYAHSAAEMRKIERHPRYKTQICRTYHEKGTCPYGVRCTFIHEQPTSSNLNIYSTEISTTRNSSKPSTDVRRSKSASLAVSKTDTADESQSTTLPWLVQSGTNFVGDQPNENKAMLPLSQMKNVAHSRSASSTSSCWSPTLPNNIWGHPGFYSEILIFDLHSQAEITTEFTKRQKRSSSIASTSSLDSSIFPADETSPKLDQTVIYSQETTNYISPIDDTWSDFTWLSLKPDMLKRPTTACLTAGP
ncbi:hypothetical protein NQZ79_g6797 [Umbelopsis isabellina]|nr:hypothetical protein NQZ79_g6797 [Umbelopsis isabellina]